MAFPWSARELVGAARQRDNEGPGVRETETLWIGEGRSSASVVRHRDAAEEDRKAWGETHW
jgi:hypothetical protein